MFQKTGQTIKQAGQRFGGGLGPVHVGPFLCGGNEPRIRGKQIIRQNGIHQVIQRRFHHEITEFFILPGIHHDSFTGGAFVQFSYCFSGFSIGRGGGSG